MNDCCVLNVGLLVYEVYSSGAYTMEATSWNLHHGSYVVGLTPWKLPHGMDTIEATSWNLHHSSYVVNLAPRS